MPVHSYVIYNNILHRFCLRFPKTHSSYHREYDLTKLGRLYLKKYDNGHLVLLVENGPMISIYDEFILSDTKCINILDETGLLMVKNQLDIEIALAKL